MHFNCYFLISTSVWIVSELWILATREYGKKSDLSLDRNSLLFTVSASGFLIITIIVAHFFFPPLPETFAIVGLIVMSLGIILRHISVHVLGQYFRTAVMIQKNHKIISHGPYKYLRHPSYTGALITFLGFGLLQANGLSIGLSFLEFFVLLYRINVEENALLKALGDSYREYSQRTKRLVPFIY